MSSLLMQQTLIHTSLPPTLLVNSPVLRPWWQLGAVQATPQHLFQLQCGALSLLGLVLYRNTLTLSVARENIIYIHVHIHIQLCRLYWKKLYVTNNFINNNIILHTEYLGSHQGWFSWVSAQIKCIYSGTVTCAKAFSNDVCLLCQAPGLVSQDAAQRKADEHKKYLHELSE